MRAISTFGDHVRSSRAPLARLGPIENFRTVTKRSCARGINQRLRCASHPASKTTKMHRRRESSHPEDASSSSESSRPDPTGRIVVERVIARESHPNWTASESSHTIVERIIAIDRSFHRERGTRTRPCYGWQHNNQPK